MTKRKVDDATEATLLVQLTQAYETLNVVYPQEANSGLLSIIEHVKSQSAAEGKVISRSAGDFSLDEVVSTFGLNYSDYLVELRTRYYWDIPESEEVFDSTPRIGTLADVSLLKSPQIFGSRFSRE
jgi:hypothetical protein